MAADSQQHPSHDELAAFGLGKLDDAAQERIERHVAACDHCCDHLLALPNDTVVAALRDADIGVEGAAEGAIADTVASFSTATPEVSAARELPAELRDHPRYRIVELLGRGGMGNVYKAEHRVMNRLVALKAINRQLVKHPTAVERFRREAQAAGQLDHPNIVRAYDAEQAGDLHLLAMEFVEGTNLAEQVAQNGPLPVETACDYVAQAAAGLQHAYKAGMIHRDIKPQNLMLATDGKIKILDFGLASLIVDAVLVDEAPAEDELQDDSGGESLTVLGSMMGTPDYIAPEQSRDARSADIRADIYGLGGTLYFLLTGQPPFPGGTALEKIRRHQSEQPVPVDKFRDDMPRELQSVLDKMLAKDPAQRYQSPADVAEALSPLSGVAAAELAQPLAPLQRSFWPRIRTLLEIVALLVLGALVWVFTDYGQIEIESHAEDVQIVVSQNGNEVTVIDLSTDSSVRWLASGGYDVRLKSDRNDVQLSQDKVSITRWGKVIVAATLYPSNSNQAEGVADGVLVVSRPERTLSGHSAAVLSVSISPDGKSVASAGLDGTIRNWDLTSGKERRRITDHDGPVSDVHFLPDGRRIVSASHDGSIRIWNVSDGSQLQRLVGHKGPVRSLALSLSGQRMLSGGDDKIARLWDLDTGRVVREFRLSDAKIDKQISKVAIFPNGQIILTAADELVVWWQKTSQGWARGGWMPMPTDLGSIAPSQDNKHFLFGPVGGNIFVRDWQHRQIIHRLIGHAGPILDMQTLDRNRVVVASGDRSVRVWDYLQNRELARFQDHRDRVETVAVSADGQWIVSGGGWHEGSRRESGHDDFALRLWKMPRELIERTSTGSDPVENLPGRLVVAKLPFSAAEARRHQELWAARFGVSRETTNSIGMQLQLIPAGRFVMGTNQAEVEELKLRLHEYWHPHLESEAPQREVTLDAPFYMAAHEVTVAQFRRFVEETGYKTEAETTGKGGTGYAGHAGTDRTGAEFNWQNVGYEQANLFPVTNVTEADAAAFCRWLTRVDGIEYRLPTEEEWEFACRAGTTTRWSFGDEAHKADGFAWHKGNAAERPHPVGRLQPNAFGIYDMHGNVVEWCANYFVETLPDGTNRRHSSRPSNRADDDSIKEHWVARNGGFLRETQWAMRSASRISGAVDQRAENESRGKFYIGFRVVRGATPPHAV